MEERIKSEKTEQSGGFQGGGITGSRREMMIETRSRSY